jgi:hypothetical protein
MGRRGNHVMKGALAGLIGGLAGTWAMNEFQRAWTYAVGDVPPQSAAGRHDARDWQERSEHQNSNEIAAQEVAVRAVGRPLRERELAVAAPLVHFAFGASVGALYGAWMEGAERPTLRHGIEFGTAVWAGADEVAMPVLGLSLPTTSRPGEMHLQSLASHLVFGATTEIVRRGIRRLI